MEIRRRRKHARRSEMAPAVGEGSRGVGERSPETARQGPRLQTAQGTTCTLALVSN